MTTQTKPQTIRILSIDAWRADGAWTWNNWHGIASMEAADLPRVETGGKLDPRKLFAFLRELGVLDDGHKGKVAADDDGHNYVVMHKGTRQPIFAIEYGALDDAQTEPEEKRTSMSADSLRQIASEPQARIVNAQRARVLRKRGEAVRFAYLTVNGKARFTWTMKA